MRFGDRPCNVIGWQLRELGDKATLHFADAFFLTLHTGHSKSVAPWVLGGQVRRQTRTVAAHSSCPVNALTVALMPTPRPHFAHTCTPNCLFELNYCDVFLQLKACFNALTCMAEGNCWFPSAN